MPLTKIFTSSAKRRIEKSLVTFLRITPATPQRVFIEYLLGMFLSTSIADGDLEFLRNKVVKISLLDSGASWSIIYFNRKLSVLSVATNETTESDEDIIISGTLRSFFLLLTRQEDPDTLFFHRKLSIEGDTELGIGVKNLLDSIEMGPVPTSFQHLLENARKLTLHS